MVRKIGLTVCLFLLIACSLVVVSAVTPVKITTYPNHTVSINFVHPETQESLDHFSGESDRFGEYSVEFTQERVFDLIILLSKDKKFVVPPTKLEGFNPGEALEFEIFNGEIKQIGVTITDDSNETDTNQTDSNQTDTNQTTLNETDSDENLTLDTSSQTQDQQVITGEAVEGNESRGYFSSALYIIIIVVVLAVIVVLFVLKGSLFKKVPGSFKIRKYSEIKDQLEKKKAEEPSSPERDKELLEAEEKIKEAQEEIKRIKERNAKMEEARKRFEEAKRELKKLQEASED